MIRMRSQEQLISDTKAIQEIKRQLDNLVLLPDEKDTIMKYIIDSRKDITYILE